MSASDKTTVNAVKVQKEHIYPLSLEQQKAYAAKKNSDVPFEFDQNGIWTTEVGLSGDDDFFFSKFGGDFFRGAMSFDDALGEKSLVETYIEGFGEYWSNARRLSAERDQARKELAPLLGKGTEFTEREIKQKEHLESRIKALEQELGSVFSWLHATLIENEAMFQSVREQVQIDINWINLGLLWNFGLSKIQEELLLCNIDVDRLGDELTELQGRELSLAEREQRQKVAVQKRVQVEKKAELEKKETELKINILRHVLEKNLGLTAEQAACFIRSMQQNLYGYHKRLMGENKPKFDSNGDLGNIDYTVSFSRQGDKIITKLHTTTDPELCSEFEMLVSDLKIDAEGKATKAPIRLIETYEIIKPGANPKIAKLDVTSAKKDVLSEHGPRRDSAKSAPIVSLFLEEPIDRRPNSVAKSASSVSKNRPYVGNLKLFLSDWRSLNLQDKPAVIDFSMRLASYLDKEINNEKNKGQNLNNIILSMLEAEHLDRIDIKLLHKMWETGECLERMSQDNLQMKFVIPFYKACIPYKRSEPLQNIVFSAIELPNAPETKVKLKQVPDYEKNFDKKRKQQLEQQAKIFAALKAKSQLAPLYHNRAELEQKLRVEKKSIIYEVMAAVGAALSTVLSFSAAIFGFSPSLASLPKEHTVTGDDNQNIRIQLKRVNQRINAVKASDSCKDNKYIDWEDAKLQQEAKKINKVLVDMGEKEAIPANLDVGPLLAGMEVEAPKSGVYPSSAPASNLEKRSEKGPYTQAQALDTIGFLASKSNSHQRQVLISSQSTSYLDPVSVRLG